MDRDETGTHGSPGEVIRFRARAICDDNFSSPTSTFPRIWGTVIGAAEGYKGIFLVCLHQTGLAICNKCEVSHREKYDGTGIRLKKVEGISWQ